uniref:Uncharacterized protein n=1 Tax=Pararge aegeria TaxID=116150 RepID=S4P6X4_9NEOP
MPLHNQYTLIQAYQLTFANIMHSNLRKHIISNEESHIIFRGCRNKNCLDDVTDTIDTDNIFYHYINSSIRLEHRQ